VCVCVSVCVCVCVYVLRISLSMGKLKLVADEVKAQALFERAHKLNSKLAIPMVRQFN
jgi:hypothetical protein